MKNNSAILSNLPQTGRIGRFIKILEPESKKDELLLIVKDANKYDSFSKEEKAAWWKNTVEIMEQQLGKSKAVQIMTRCGAKCCGKGQRETAQRLMEEAGSLENFLDKISKHDVKAGELTYVLENKNTIIADHNKCFCQQVAHTKQQFQNLTYCQCSVEFNRQFFTAALGKEAQVELLHSIIGGAKSCKFKITF